MCIFYDENELIDLDQSSPCIWKTVDIIEIMLFCDYGLCIYDLTSAQKSETEQISVGDEESKYEK